MTEQEKPFRFLLIQPFQLLKESRYLHRPVEGPKETRLMNYDHVKHLFEDVEWELHPGALQRNGEWRIVNGEWRRK